MELDYVRYYNLERYLFEDVHRRFHEDGSLGAFEFFSIVVWKANRAKSRVARRLLDRDPGRRKELQQIVCDLTRDLYRAANAKARLRLLMEGWGFLLPMGSAILSVLWPDEFTVYDVRACEQLGNFQEVGSNREFEAVWQGYSDYLDAIRLAAPSHLTLRDKDRYLWAKSVASQLERDIVSVFSVETQNRSGPTQRLGLGLSLCSGVRRAAPLVHDLSLTIPVPHSKAPPPIWWQSLDTSNL